jgi:hypothetical protein
MLSCYSHNRNEKAYHHQPPRLRFGDATFDVALPNMAARVRAFALTAGFVEVVFAVASPNTPFTVTCFGAAPNLATILSSLQEITFPSTAVVRAHLPQPQFLDVVTEVPEPLP